MNLYYNSVSISDLFRSKYRFYEMSPISPTSAPIEPIPTSDISTKKNLARSKWKVLASAIARKRNPSKKPDPESLLRFPSYRVIDARPVTSSSNDALLWFVVSLPQHLAIDLKVNVVKNRLKLTSCTLLIVVSMLRLVAIRCFNKMHVYSASNS